jgi:translation initiation factor RLI1
MNGITKTGYEAIVKVLSGPVRDRLEAIEHQDVYDDIVGYFADKLGEEFDNFNEDKFINAT